MRLRNRRIKDMAFAVRAGYHLDKNGWRKFMRSK